MGEASQPSRTVKAALFVDFDNIYSGLKSNDPKAAEEFAYNPARWLAWFERGMPTRDTDDAAGLRQRALLLRLCYLNPVMFGRFRPYFTRSGFKVVDCPPLTQQNKNSTDIHMVMDILDALRYEHVREFIILSGDSDFTPVLLRLRLFDRSTIILTPGPVAQSYKAASDLVISEDVFTEEGLGLRPERGRGVLPAAPAAARPAGGGGEEHVLDAMARRVYERAAAGGPVPAAALPGIYRQFSSFAASDNWLGFYSLIDLTRELVRRRAGLHVADCYVDGKKSWEVRCGLTSAPQEEEAAAPAAVTPAAQEEAAALDEKIVARVSELVAASPSPVSMAAAAADVIKNVGQEVLTTQWAGAGTFKELLRSADAVGFVVAISPDGPGYLYDPSRHSSPVAAPPDETEEWEGHPEELLAFARRVGRVTGAPLLRPEDYAVVFKALEDELREEDYFLASTSRAVRDRCTLRGHAVSRKDISFILKGITYGGHDFDENPLANSAGTFAQVFREQVHRLCKSAQLELSGEEQGFLEQWIRT